MTLTPSGTTWPLLRTTLLALAAAWGFTALAVAQQPTVSPAAAAASQPEPASDPTLSRHSLRLRDIGAYGPIE